MSSARAFLRPVRNRPNLHIMLNATVTKVLINPTTKATEGIEFIKNGSKQTARARKEVVLAAGAINSPQILLLSGIGPKEDLAKLRIPLVHDLRGVGQNLHNHVAVFIDFILKDNATADLDWLAITNYLINRTGPLSSTGLSQVQFNSVSSLYFAFSYLRLHHHEEHPYFTISPYLYSKIHVVSLSLTLKTKEQLAYSPVHTA
jgi:choline dehydrogenase